MGHGCSFERKAVLELTIDGVAQIVGHGVVGIVPVIDHPSRREFE